VTDEMMALRKINPVRGGHVPAFLDTRAEHDLRWIIDEHPRTSSPRRWLTWAAAAASVVVLSVAAVTSGLSDGTTVTAQAATPAMLTVRPVDAGKAKTLMGLAAISARQPSIDPRRIRSFRFREWSLSARIAGRTVTTAIVPVEHSGSWTAERSGRTTSTVGEPQFPSSASRKAWGHDGRDVRAGSVIEAQTFDAGEFPLRYQGVVPDEPAALRAFLAVGHPIDSYGPGELFVAITDLLSQQRLTPSQQSSLLRLLAVEPAVRVLGDVTDRAGRAGVAVVAEGDFTGLPTRFVLVFDPGTGALLASEAWLTTSAGRLPVSIPAVIDYKIWS
jgi:hypothetical protein